jgi:tight adherence protein C
MPGEIGGIPIDIIVTALSALAAFATVITLAMPVLTGDRLTARLKSVASRRDELRRKSREALKNGQSRSLRDAPKGFMKQVVDGLKLDQLMEAPNTKDMLMRAGLRGQRPFITFMFARLVAPIGLLAAAAFYIYGISEAALTITQQLAALLAAVTAGYYLPTIIVRNMIERREESIIKAFPDALDLLLICVESGMSIEAAFNKVAAEIGEQSVELAEEMALTTAELSYLPDRQQAYQNLGKRVNTAGVKAVCTSLTQAERYGTPLGHALRVMAQENRTMRMQMAEKKAAALPAKLTVPMIAFFLPVLFIVILGPAGLKMM